MMGATRSHTRGKTPRAVCKSVKVRWQAPCWKVDKLQTGEDKQTHHHKAKPQSKDAENVKTHTHACDKKRELLDDSDAALQHPQDLQCSQPPLILYSADAVPILSNERQQNYQGSPFRRLGACLPGVTASRNTSRYN